MTNKSIKLSNSFFDNEAEGAYLLSPHFDDICFSLASFSYRLKRGKIFTLFSWSANIVNEKIKFIVGAHNLKGGTEAFDYSVGLVSRLRLTEEKDFCRDIAFDLALGCFVDAPLRGRHPFKDSIQNALEDTKIFSEKIRAILESIAHPKSNQAKPLLLCPIGIGNHIDHLIVLNVIVQNLDPIRAKFRVGFYEDLPYASKSQNRQVGIDPVSYTHLTLPTKRIV